MLTIEWLDLELNLPLHLKLLIRILHKCVMRSCLPLNFSLSIMAKKLFKSPALPNKDLAGSFDCMNQLIALDAYKSTDIYINDATLSKVEKRRRIVPAYITAFHEYTHFLDFTTSSYGLNFIDVLFSAAEDYSEGCKSPLESDNAMAFMRLSNEINNHEMHTAHRRPELGMPWEYRNALMDSRRFDSDTEVYMTVMTMYSKRINEEIDEFARAPISIQAMMESNAVFNELYFANMAIRSEPSSEAEQNEELAKLTHDSKNFFYNSELLTYSTAVHFVANALHLDDIIDAAAKTSYLTRFCLDLAETTMREFTLPPDLLQAPYESLHERVQAEIRSGNLSVAFYVMTLAMMSIDANADMRQWISHVALRAGFGIPLLETMKYKRRILQRLKARKAVNGQYKGLVQIIEKNIQIKYFGGLYDFNKYQLPCILLQDGLLFHPHQPTLPGAQVAKSMGFDPQEHAVWMEQFSSWLAS